MKKIIVAVICALLPALAPASEGVHLEKANISLTNKASLQRGAKYFVNYCLNCHSAAFMRYSRMAKDLGLTEAQVTQNLMFTAEKLGQPMTVAMSKEDAKHWFGTPPPDLSVVARSRGVDWLYTYLKSFYLDGSRPFGVNNLVFKDVAMPAVLWDLQGWQRPVYTNVTEADGSQRQVVSGVELVEQGKLSPAEYDKVVRDLVNFLAYMGEPAKLERQRVGVWVILFLLIFFVVAYLLKKEYWKDVH